MDLVGHSLGHAAAGSKAAACAGGIHHGILGFHIVQMRKVYALGLKHTGQLFKGKHKVHIAAHMAAAGFQLFGGAGAHKAHTRLRVGLFHHAGGEHHGGHGHGNVAGQLGEQGFGHHAPAGAAAGCHKALLGGHFLQKVLGFVHGAKVSANGNLHHILKAQLLHGGTQLGGVVQGRELVYKSGGDQSIHAVAALDALDQLEDLALVRNSAEGAAY